MSKSGSRDDGATVSKAWPGVPANRRAIMRSNTRRDTKPELALRSLLHRRGLRFRVDLPVRPDGGRPIRPDIVFPRRYVAVFVDGCFWHGCPLHGSQPATNAGYWSAKFVANRERDAKATSRLESGGWTVLRFWEHLDLTGAAEAVADAVAKAAGHSRETRPDGRKVRP